QEPIGKRKAIEAVWYTGRMMGETLAHTICGNRTAYNPGHWFNSAKFLDIEYQTYGWVNPAPLEKNRHFHWMHQDQSKCITIEYNQSTGEVNGINTFGIRLRHEVFHQWLTEKQDIDFVLKNLGKANFDPEFYARYEGDILEKYNLDLASV
ncbi:MAG TPA: FAD-dependent oxidoreductase, partial [Bacteroidetes bacterium]|nr:FAD-dependent oxidoreductase [Bacteroidota bacterium]